MKKLLAYLLTIALTATVAIGGTVAYLQDSDSDVNVMTTGSVHIKQHEYERVVDENGDWVEALDYKVTFGSDTYTPDKLQEFTQGKPAYPAVYTDGTTKWDDRNGSQAASGTGSHQQGWAEVGAPGSNQLFDDSVKNVIDKFVFVENTGKSDAYYRTIIAIESPEDNTAAIHLNTNGNSRFDWEDLGYTEIDGVRYSLRVVTYNQILTPGEVSRPSLLQLFLDPTATNEDYAAFGDTWEVLVVSQAVQTAGFDDAKSALDEAFGEITVENHPWVDATIADELGITEAGTYNLKGDVYTIDSGYFHTQKVTGDVTINGNGATVEGIATSVDSFTWEGGTIPAMSAIFSSENGSKVTVNDVNFSGIMSAIMMGHYKNSTYNNYNTVFNNVNVIDTEVVSFSSNISPAVCVYGTATLNNCNIYGTTLSKLDTDPMWPVYDLAVVNYSDTTINNSKIGSIYMWNQAGVTVAEGSEVDTIVICGNMNTTKYGLTIKAGATVNTIDLSNITDKTRVNITIEDGATVNAIVANGVNYDSITAWQNNISSAKEMGVALTNGGLITLTADVDLSTNANGTVITKDTVIDLGGNTISSNGLYESGKNGTQIAVLTIDNGANVTIKNGTVTGSEYGIYVKNGTLTIEDGTYYGNTSAVQVNKGTLNISGGTFKVTSGDEIYTINCIDASYKDGSANVIVTGGEFYRFSPNYNLAEGNGTDFVPEGYKTVRNAETQYYVVTKE